MSHSQFHSIKLFTLRHAWLNLWDKHMTTGRINQITIVQRMASFFELWTLQIRRYEEAHRTKKEKPIMNIKRNAKSLEVLFCFWAVDKIIICCGWILREQKFILGDSLVRVSRVLNRFERSRHAPTKAKVCHVLVGFSLREAIWTAVIRSQICKYKKTKL